ncbi:MAG: hypothetical protein ACW98D_18490 [Promethearchaeota archaeon]|jgi:hypothetical protein
MIQKKFTLVFSAISGIMIIVAFFFPFLSTFFAGENHRYYSYGTVLIIEALGTIRYYFLIPGEFALIMFTLNSIIFWVAGIALLINAVLIYRLKDRQTNTFSILSVIGGGLVIVLILIVYFTFPFIGAGITLTPDIGFILSLIGGLSAIVGGALDIIKEKKSAITS